MMLDESWEDVMGPLKARASVLTTMQRYEMKN